MQRMPPALREAYEETRISPARSNVNKATFHGRREANRESCEVQDLDRLGAALHYARTGIPPKPMRILIVEDDPVLADGLNRSLRATGYAVDCAADGADRSEERRVGEEGGTRGGRGPVKRKE